VDAPVGLAHQGACDSSKSGEDGFGKTDEKLFVFANSTIGTKQSSFFLNIREYVS